MHEASATRPTAHCPATPRQVRERKRVLDQRIAESLGRRRILLRQKAHDLLQIAVGLRRKDYPLAHALIFRRTSSAGTVG